MNQLSLPVKMMIAAGLSFAVGSLSGIVISISPTDWFLLLEKPSWEMPAYLFGPIWTILYILMGAGIGLVWHQGIENTAVKIAIRIYALQLTLHSLWAVLFFGLKMPGLALIENALLWGVVLLCSIHFYRVKKLAGYLMIPYLLWGLYVFVLNFALWQLN